MGLLNLVPPLEINGMQYQGIDPTGSTDSTTAINNALGDAGVLGGPVGLPAGSFQVSTPLVVPPGAGLDCAGRGVTFFVMTVGFTGAAVITMSGNSYSSLKDFSIIGPAGISGVYTSNPACDGIDMSGCADCNLEHLELDAINGWAITSIGTSSVGNQKIRMTGVTSHLSAQGIHVMGVSGSNYVGLHEFINCNVSGTQNGDCYLIEDVHDILMTQCTGETTAGSGASIHVKGNVGAVNIMGGDYGPASGPALGSIINITAGPNGSPKNIMINGCIIEGGTYGITASSGSYIVICGGCRIFNNNLAGVNINDPASVEIIGCQFNQNGSVAGSGRYELVNSSNQPVYYTANKFDTPQGSSAGQVNACINDTGALGCYNGNFHNSAGGWTASNIFAAGGTPHLYQNVMGLTPQGMITPPSTGASPWTIGGVGYPRFIYVTGGTVSEIDLGGTNTTRTSGGFLVPPRTSLTITYSVAPTIGVSTIST